MRLADRVFISLTKVAKAEAVVGLCTWARQSSGPHSGLDRQSGVCRFRESPDGWYGGFAAIQGHSTRRPDCP